MKFSRLLSLLILLLLPTLSHALKGKVVSVADGDTITVLDSSKKQHRIRLYGIDCPEKGQAFGKAAKKITSRPTYNKKATVTEYDIDKFDRTVGVVLVDGANVNEEIIRAGYAWQYRKYCKASFCDDWLKTEKKAKKAKDGLWNDPAPVPPWLWRKGVRNNHHRMTQQEPMQQLPATITAT